MSQIPYQHLLVDPLTGLELPQLFKLSSRVDCLLPNAHLALEHIAGQWHMLSTKLQRDISEEEALLKHPNLHPLMRERMQTDVEWQKKFLGQLQEIFKSIPTHVKSAFHDKTLQGLGHTLPLTQPLIGHPKNIFRDWSWGEAENRRYLELVQARVQGEKKNILVIAAGAGRLAYDLHHHLKAQFTFALDNSYFFSECFQRICWGEGVELVEFPAPRLGDENLAHEHKLMAPSLAREGLVFHLGDLNYLPYRPESFDLIITPWIIDLIPSTLPFLISNISSLLNPQGQWINFGPYSLPSDIPARYRWSQNEIRGFIEEVGLENFEETWEQVEYLKSPHTSLTRQERMWTFSCTKLESTGLSIQRPQLKESWLIHHDHAIPLSSKVQMSLMTHKVPARVFELINGKRSLNQIARVIMQEFQMSEAEAQQALVHFLSRWAESG